MSSPDASVIVKIVADFQAPVGRGQTLVWTGMPAVNDWLREQRNALVHPEPRLLHGINATLIVQCAIFIDGLLASGLTSALPYPKDTNSIDARLNAECHDRVHRTYTFDNNSTLFKIVTGKTLGDLMKTNQRWESLQVLFKFRNGLAHGRLIEYRVYFYAANDKYEPDFSGGYSEVEAYLLKKDLINIRVKEGGTGWPFLESNIADHFCDLISPVAYDIVDLLPDANNAKGGLRSTLDDVFTKRPSGR